LGSDHIVKQVWALFLGFLLLTVGVIAWVQRNIDPPVETIVASSLKSVQEQNRLTAFAARFVTVVTSRKSQMGFSAEKTLIIPAMVRYEVDMATLTTKDLSWDAAAKTLTITMPPVELAGPEFDLAATREYQSGTVLMALTDVEKLLDRENRVKATADVLAQAKATPMLKLARDASARALMANFALPFKAAGIEATVLAR
jgi:hypothetical protein